MHAQGAAIWIQIGHAGLFAMEAWHEPYASQRREPLLSPSDLRWYLRPVFRRAPVHAMTTDEVHAMCVRYGEVAAWAREAGYDGVQLASSNAKLIDQFLSPFYNRRTDEFGGSPEGRARILELIRHHIAERAGADFTCTVKVPVAEKAPPFTPRTTWDEGVRLAQLCEEWGYDSVTPVHVSVLPDSTLSRGGIPSSLWRNKAMQTRFRRAAKTRFERAVLMAGYVGGGLASPFRPVWNRSRFRAVKSVVSIPVLAVGRHPHARRGRADPRRRRGRHGRHRPARSTPSPTSPAALWGRRVGGRRTTMGCVRTRTCACRRKCSA